jgi:hypothetical protein
MFRINLYALLILLVTGLASVDNAFSQNVGDYQTQDDGNWNDIDTWEKWDGSGWDNCVPGDYRALPAGDPAVNHIKWGYVTPISVLQTV